MTHELIDAFVILWLLIMLAGIFVPDRWFERLMDRLSR